MKHDLEQFHASAIRHALIGAPRHAAPPANGGSTWTRELHALHRLCAQTRGCASVIDPHSGRFLDVNENTCLVSGYTRREFLRLSVADIDPTVPAAWSYAREINARKDTGKLLREGVIRRKDGGLVRVSVSSTIVHIHDGHYMLACAERFPDKKPPGDESSLRVGVFDAMDSGVLVTAIDGTIRDLNVSAERLFGLTRACAIGKNVATLPVLRGGRSIPPSASRALERGKQWRGQISLSVPPRKPRVLRIIGTRLLDFSGNRIGSVWIGRDITAQKRFEEALKRSEKRFKVIFERAKDAIFIESEEGEILEANHAASALLGYSREDLLSMRVSDLVPREEAARPPARAGTAYRQTEMLRKDGQKIPVDARRSLAEVGGLTCVIAIVRDISGRERMEEEVRSAARRFEQLAELTSAWVWETDAARRFTYSNAVGTRLVGYAPEELLGRIHIHDLFSPGDAEARKAFATGKRLRESRTVFVRKDGRETVLSTNAFPILDESGNFEGYRGSGVEMSATDREREELRRMSERLKASNRDLDQFAGIASHDLLSPLNTLSGYLNLLKESPSAAAAPSTTNCLAPCMEAIDRMHALIRDLLTYSRIGTRKKPPGPVDCGKIVQVTLANLRGAVSALGARVTVGKLPTVVAVPSQILQVFQNLVSNALQHHGSKPLRIRISSRRGPREWVFSVSDNGIGIPAADLERIFAPMERLRTAANRSGTGLGLAIVKKIVESHGGRVWVTSVEGRGASFRFTIPDRAAGDNAAEPPAGNGAGAANGGADEGR